MRFTIYQPKTPSFTVDHNKTLYDITDYNVTYNGYCPTQANTSNMLEEIFEHFNIRRPEDFKGHSLSVGDIVVLDNDYSHGAFICDIVGFSKIELTFHGRDPYSEPKDREQHLFVNGAEVLRIQNGEFWKVTDDGECMEKVDFDTFWKQIGKYNWILNTENKDLEDDYLDLITAAIINSPKKK